MKKIAMQNKTVFMKRASRLGGWLLVWALALFGLFFLMQAKDALASPTAPVNLVNHALKQCLDDVILGDECFYCTPKEGWEISAESCPVGYTTAGYDSVLNCATHLESVYESTCPNYITPTDTPLKRIVPAISAEWLVVLGVLALGFVAVVILWVVLKRKRDL